VTGGRRGLPRPLAVAVLLALTVAFLTGAPADGRLAGTPSRVLQLNLCDSGIASCYTGRAVARAGAVIRADAPDLVTLNEICQEDLYPLDRALVAVHGGGAVVSAFKAAVDRRTGGDFRCRNGQPYGVGLLLHVPGPSTGYSTDGGVYPQQDTRDPEERVWLCVYATGDVYACVTHLASTSATVALAQCRYLLTTAIPAARRSGGYRPTVLGGDLNLTDPRSCVPPGYVRRGDGGVQQVVATDDFVVDAAGTVDMARTTDHPGLLVTLAAG
jgi:endonuclease/exonuclease/phosphatase family metal-dependent hydrolase